jgi:hypothetical protein
MVPDQLASSEDNKEKIPLLSATENKPTMTQQKQQKERSSSSDLSDQRTSVTMDPPVKPITVHKEPSSDDINIRKSPPSSQKEEPKKKIQ